MTRVLGVLVHNWPLKLAAIGLATLLYGGFVVSQSTASLDNVVVPVDVRNQPKDSFVLTVIRSVSQIRYFSPSGVQPISSDFHAWVDLAGVVPGGGPQTIPVQVEPIDRRITVVDFEPRVVTVDLDRLDQKTVTVEVERGPTPTGLELGAMTVSPTEVQVSGPASVIQKVVAARANVLIQSGLDIDQDVDLVPVDAVGDAVGQVKLLPGTARVTIPVFSDRQSKTLPISPAITGSPAAGFDLASATVEPRIANVEGDGDQLAALLTLETEPISINGLSSDTVLTAKLALPTGVVALDVQQVTVTIKLRLVTATRTFEVGVDLVGERSDRDYALGADRVLVTIGGSIVELDRLDGAALVASIDVSDVASGTASLPVSIDLPAGVTLVAISPSDLQVTVTAVTPPPTPSAIPSASPGG